MFLWTRKWLGGAILLSSGLLALCCFGQTFGTWKLRAFQSTPSGGSQPRSFSIRIEAHSRGEVFTLDRIESDGRATLSSTILYFDGIPRQFQDAECSGTQSSRRIDNRTAEIIRKCGAGAWTKLVRRTAAKSNELVLQVSEQRADGRRFERLYVFEKK